MVEYEYSFEVKNWQPFIEFCEKNGFVKKEDLSQTRVIYRNENKTMARLTFNEANGKVEKALDFKEDKLSKEDLTLRRESASLIFDDEQAAKSILEFLNYKEDNTLKRLRKTYQKGNVKFELDCYFEPRKCYVVAIEGEKEEVDKLYQKVKNFR